MNQMSMLQTASILLLLTAAGGILMAFQRLAHNANPPHWLAMAHGLLAASGLTLLIYAALYVSVLCLGSVQVGRRTGLPGFLLAPLVFFILHFAYGLGCLWGVVRFVFLKRGSISQQMSR